MFYKALCFLEHVMILQPSTKKVTCPLCKGVPTQVEEHIIFLAAWKQTFVNFGKFWAGWLQCQSVKATPVFINHEVIIRKSKCQSKKKKSWFCLNMVNGCNLNYLRRLSDLVISSISLWNNVRTYFSQIKLIKTSITLNFTKFSGQIF